MYVNKALVDELDSLLQDRSQFWSTALIPISTTRWCSKIIMNQYCLEMSIKFRSESVSDVCNTIPQRNYWLIKSDLVSIKSYSSYLETKLHVTAELGDENGEEYEFIFLADM